jgi:multidrug efflux pump subunit AcrB
MVKGVALVEVYGSQKYAVRIQLDPQASATRQIGIDDVQKAVPNANVNMPVGTLYGEHRAFTLQANARLARAFSSDTCDCEFNSVPSRSIAISLIATETLCRTQMKQRRRRQRR